MPGYWSSTSSGAANDVESQRFERVQCLSCGRKPKLLVGAQAVDIRHSEGGSNLQFSRDMAIHSQISKWNLEPRLGCHVERTHPSLYKCEHGQVARRQVVPL
jgi:hypothetical protein